MAKGINKEVQAENDRLFGENQKLKNLLTDALYEVARYQGTMEARKEHLKGYENLQHLVAEIDKDIARVTRLRFNIKEAIFNR